MYQCQNRLLNKHETWLLFVSSLSRSLLENFFKLVDRQFDIGVGKHVVDNPGHQLPVQLVQPAANHWHGQLGNVEFGAQLPHVLQAALHRVVIRLVEEKLFGYQIEHVALLDLQVGTVAHFQI